MKNLFQYVFISLVFCFISSLFADSSSSELSYFVKKETEKREQVLSTLNSLLDQALGIQYTEKNSSRISPESDRRLTSIGRDIEKNMEILKEASRRVSFFTELQKKNVKTKAEAIDVISKLSRAELFGLVETPDKEANTLFFVNLAVALKSFDIQDKDVFIFIDRFTDFVTIGKPKSLANFFTVYKAQQTREISSKKLKNTDAR